jgi:Flp pilus assembly CpaE family ATPase/DNA-binding NarL/FixJ family response regulator
VANAIHVLIVDDIATTLDNLRKLLAFEDDIDVVGTAGTGREAVAEAKRLHPDVVLMDVNMPEMDGIQATEIMASETPESPVIIMSVQGERDYLRRAMQSGAREFLIKPFSGDELVASVRRVHQLEQRKETYGRVAVAPAPPEAASEPEPAGAADSRPFPELPPDDARPTPPSRDASKEAAEAPPAPATGPRVEPAAAEAFSSQAPVADMPQAEAPVAEAAVAMEPTHEAAPPREATPPSRQVYGEQVVFYGGKGGVGTSVLAVNLACAFARETGARVALVDLDLQFGDLGVLLNLPQTQSISDLVDAIDIIDPDFVADVMSTGPAGIKVLPAATSPELADLVTPEHVEKILGLLRTTFDFVVVDTSSHLGDVTLAALDTASSVILVTAPSITSVKSAKLALRLMESISIPTAAITLVLNRCEAHSEFNRESIESHLKFPISIQVPHDPRTIVNSISRGNPFVVSSPEVEASQRVRQLAAHLLPEKIATAPPLQRSRGLRFGRR